MVVMACNKLDQLALSQCAVSAPADEHNLICLQQDAAILTVDTGLLNSCGASGQNPEITTNNPCYPATGDKRLSEVDITLPGLSFSRHYRSLSGYFTSSLGESWSHNHYRAWQFEGRSDTIATFTDAVLNMGSGSQLRFIWSAERNRFVSDENPSITAYQAGAEYRLDFGDGSYEVYDIQGNRVAAVQNLQRTNYEYTDTQLTKIIGHFGHSLSLDYDSQNRLISVTDHLGEVYGYEYDSKGRLGAMRYPDETADNADNPRRIYHYEDADYPNHITGITDANGCLLYTSPSPRES